MLVDIQFVDICIAVNYNSRKIKKKTAVLQETYKTVCENLQAAREEYTEKLCKTKSRKITHVSHH